MQEASIVLAAFVVYFVPLLAAAAGAVLGGFVGNQLAQSLVRKMAHRHWRSLKGRTYPSSCWI
ncbi:hypothetical protein GH810_11845 [Acetobacterium paludosum]|uniref:Uncharacterized protein n=1 Tax=Acetobacterium paludosum TaxID=52693 RepID=A0A923HVF9_9FIRM|nr:hypothetical protein [Acetobacterium paludosum]MBC3889006.1 hypothetical protein [Acetobacterium paludosum]